MDKPEKIVLLEEEWKPVSFSDDFPLHYLARVGDPTQLKLYFTTQAAQAAKEIHRLDFCQRTPLHYVALSDDLTGGEQCVEELLTLLQKLEIVSASDGKGASTIALSRSLSRRERRILREKVDIGEHTLNFINRKDKNGETALSLAAINENADVVKILLAKSADVATRSDSGDYALELIYENTPSAVIGLLNQSVIFDYGNKSYDLTEIERSYEFDLRPIVGESEIPSSLNINKDVFKEVDLLHSVNKDRVRARGEILKHPVVQLFLKKKSDKFRYFTWFAIINHLIWIGLYNWIVLDVYYTCCDCGFAVCDSNLCVNYEYLDLSNRTSASNSNNSKLENIPNGGGNSSCPMEGYNLPKDANYVDLCISCKDTTVRAIFVLLISIVIAIKEVYKMFFLKRSYLKVKSSFIWIFIIILLLTAIPNWPIFAVNIQFQLSSFGIIISAVVVIELVQKHIYWAIYIKVLLKVFNRFLAILPIFVFIMIVFAVSLRMHFPNVHSPLTPWLQFRNAVMSIFETIASGKVTWEDTYQESIDKNFKISGFIMYTGFYVIVALLLFKMLTGFVVSDTKKMQEKEQINSISGDLEAIFIYESFLLSNTYDWLSNQNCFKFLDSFREKFLLCQRKDGNRILKMTVNESEIPTYDLRKSIRMLASKNTVKLQMPKFLTPSEVPKCPSPKSKRSILPSFRIFRRTRRNNTAEATNRIKNSELKTF